MNGPAQSFAPGTLCAIVGDPDCFSADGLLMPVPSRLCTITAIPGCCGHANCEHVCTFRFNGDGTEACCGTWSCLRPITPPGAETTRDEPMAEMA